MNDSEFNPINHPLPFSPKGVKKQGFSVAVLSPVAQFSSSCSQHTCSSSAANDHQPYVSASRCVVSSKSSKLYSSVSSTWLELRVPGPKVRGVVLHQAHERSTRSMHTQMCSVVTNELSIVCFLVCERCDFWHSSRSDYLTTTVPFYSNTDTDNATLDFTKGGTSLTFRGFSSAVAKL